MLNYHNNDRMKIRIIKSHHQHKSLCNN